MKKSFIFLARLMTLFLLVISMGLVGYISYLFLTQRIVLKLDFTEHLDFYSREGIFVFYVIVALLVLVAVSTVIDRVPSWLLFVLSTSATITFGVYLIFNVDAVIRTDPKYIFETAILFNKGNFDALTPGFFDHGQHYLWVYPDQLGLVSFYRMFALFSTSVRSAFLFNLAMVIGIQFFQWRIVDNLFSSKKISSLSIVLSFLFLPLLFLTLWIYGDIPGLLGLVIAVYCFLKYRESKHPVAMVLYALVLLAAIGVSCLIRSNYMIFAIALAIQILLDAIANTRLKNVFLIPLIAIAMLVPKNLMNQHYEETLGRDLPKGTPKIAWVTMGLRDDPYPSQAGWWDAYTTFLMTWANDDYDTAKKMAEEELDSRVKALKSDKDYALSFFKNKFASTWAEPTIQSLQAGPIVSKEQYTHTSFLKSLYESGKAHEHYQLGMSIYLACLYLSVLVVLGYGLFVKGGHFEYPLLYPLIYLWGGALFHLVWETKSRYTMPYVYLAIPLFAYGLSLLSQPLSYHSTHREERRRIRRK